MERALRRPRGEWKRGRDRGLEPSAYGNTVKGHEGVRAMAIGGALPIAV